MISSDSTHYHSNVFNQVIILINKCIGDMHRSLGYRHVHLYTIGGDLIANAYLFVHIVISSKSLAVVSIWSSPSDILHVLFSTETSSNSLTIPSFICSPKITCCFLSNCVSKANRWSFQSKSMLSRWSDLLWFFFSRSFNRWKVHLNIDMLSNEV